MATSRTVAAPVVSEMVTAPKLLAEVASKISAVPLVAVNVVAPVTVTAPLWLMSPAEETFRVPAVPPPRMMAPLSLRVTVVKLPPLLGAPKVTVPKLLAEVERSAVIALVSAVIVVTPTTFITPLWEIAPTAVRLRLPVPVMFAPVISIALLLFRVTLPPDVRSARVRLFVA